MLPTNMELRIRSGTVGYNNKILVSDGKFNLGENDEVNSSETPAIKNHKTTAYVTCLFLEWHIPPGKGVFETK